MMTQRYVLMTLAERYRPAAEQALVWRDGGADLEASGDTKCCVNLGVWAWAFLVTVCH